MADVLQVELEILDEKAIQVKNQFVSDFKQQLSAIPKGFTKDIQSDLVNAERKTLSLQQSLKSLAAVDPTGKGLDWISKAALKSQKEIAGINKQLQTIQKLASQTSSRSLLKIYEDDARSLSQQLDKNERQLLRLQQARLNKAQPVSRFSQGSKDFVSGGLDATGLPITAAAGGAVVVAGAISLTSKLVDGAYKGADANRVLAATAKETGKAYDVLTEKAEKFGALTAQAENDAKRSYASILQFAKAAGRTEQVDQFTQSLADLAAAKGIAADQLPTLIGQLKTGQDEVFDKLKGVNPSTLYDAYARSVGKTAESLTDLEKAQVRFDAILKDGALFSGEAEKRLGDISGKVDTLGASFSNLTTRIGNNLSPFFKAQIDNLLAVGDFIKGKGLFASDEEKAKLREQARKDLDERTKLIVQGLRESDQKIREAQKNPYGSLENLALSRVNIATGFNDPVVRQQSVDQAREQATKEAEAYKKSFEAVIADKNSSIPLLQLAQKEFEKVQNILPEDVKKRIRDGLSQAISDGVAKGFQKALSDENQTAKNLTENLKKLVAGVAGLLPETREKLIKDFESAIKSMSQKAQAVKEQVRDVLVQSAGVNNPLVKLMADFESATERAEKRFGVFGANFAAQMAEIERQQLQAQINQQLFENNKKALDYQQQARRLQQLPETQTGGFQRNLALLGSRADFLLQDRDLSRRVAEAQFYASRFNPNNPKSFDQAAFGNQSADQIQLRRALETIKDLSALGDGGTGTFGRGLIAQKIAEVLPDRELLLRQLQQGGAGAFDAQQLLNIGADSALALKEASQAKFKEVLAQNDFAQLAVKEAEEKIKQLQSSKLTDPQKIQEFLNITQELGTENLTPELRRARISALNSAADFERNQQAASSQAISQMAAGMKTITDQLSASGLKVSLNDVPVVEIEVKSGDLAASQRSLGSRANSSDVQGLNQ